ncbi:hypothetical protein D9M68_963110 [compost metagenome]
MAANSSQPIRAEGTSSNSPAMLILPASTTIRLVEVPRNHTPLLDATTMLHSATWV